MLMSTGFVSPYFSGYDLPVCMAGFALILPDLVRLLPAGQAAALLAGTGLAGFVNVPLAVLERFDGAPLPSIGGPLSLLCFLAAARTLRGADPRSPRAAIPFRWQRSAMPTAGERENAPPPVRLDPPDRRQPFRRPA